MLIASFDIGKKNFAFCIEKNDPKFYDQFENNGLKYDCYQESGKPTTQFEIILDKVYRNGDIILYSNNNLTSGCNSKKNLEQNIFHNMTDVLDKYKEYWSQCDIIVIEQQMKRNHMATKLGQHCYSYFLINYGRFKTVIEFPSYYKTQKLGCEKINSGKYKNGKTKWKCITKNARKKWAVEKAKYILNLRDDQVNLKILADSKKKDDLADVICQLQSFKIIYFLEGSSMEC